MSEIEPWYFDGDPSSLYERLLVPAKFLPWAEDLVRISDPLPGEKVLDVACGTGTVTRLIPHAVGVSGEVTGLDFALAGECHLYVTRVDKSKMNSDQSIAQSNS